MGALLMFFLVVLARRSENLDTLFAAEELVRRERYTCVFLVDVTKHVNTAETAFTSEQLARGESNWSYFPHNSITHYHNVVP